MLRVLTTDTVPYATRRYSQAFRDSSVLEWVDRSTTDSILSRGFLGRDQGTGQLFYIGVSPGAPPVAIAGEASSGNTIEWSLLPGADGRHPFNRGLVHSRLTFVSRDRMDWRGAVEGGWHFVFERVR
jgi:hypothetical protein